MMPMTSGALRAPKEVMSSTIPSTVMTTTATMASAATKIPHQLRPGGRAGAFDRGKQEAAVFDGDRRVGRKRVVPGRRGGYPDPGVVGGVRRVARRAVDAREAAVRVVGHASPRGGPHRAEPVPAEG